MSPNNALVSFERRLFVEYDSTGAPYFRTSLVGIAVAGDGRLYAVGDNQVKVFDHRGTLEECWRPTPDPNCIAVGTDGTVCVAGLGWFERFTEHGKLLSRLHDPARMGRITAIASLRDEILLADGQRRLIHRVGLAGDFLGEFGAKGKRRDVIIPNGHLDIAVSPVGVVFVAHSGRHRIERYSADGEFLGHFGKFGVREPADFPGCCNPTDIALAPDGSIIAADKAPPRVKIYDAKYTFVGVLADRGFDPECKYLSLEVDPEGRIFVADTAALKIHLFTPSSEKAPNRALQEAAP